ncbi:MAG TPA: YceI family protein [Steroidobacteraceae bacterium]|jgi:polyisoprenoid-binding protein YceI|nr:YceI family protein [Steroidobacteraceae bacterium]
MIRRLCLAASPALTASFVLASTPLWAATYTLEPDYTQGVFRWNHLGFSSPAAQFAQGTGTLEFDPSDPSKWSVQVTIPLASLNTGVPALDDDFRSTDFFDTAKFPTATFKSTKVVKRAAADHLDVTGDLSLHGVTKPVTLDVTVVKIGINPRTNVPTVGFDATTTLKRSDFGLGKYVPQVGDEVEMHIIVQAVDAAANAEYQTALAARRAAKAMEAAKDAAKGAAKDAAQDEAKK